MLLKMIIKIVSTLALLFSALCSSASQPIDIIIPGPLEGKPIRNPFIEDLLHLVFEKQNYQLNLKYHQRTYTQGRALKELSLGEDIDLNWSTTSIDREKLLKPIRFPLYQGLIGWRVMFIRKGEQARFDEVNTVNDLKKLLAVQRFDWTDYDIFKENQLPIEGNFTFPQLSKAVSSSLADYFPRSVLEILHESGFERNQSLAIEETLLITYPSAYYFFVHKENEALAVIIQQGLEKAYQDGAYQALFEKHFANTFEKLNISQRKVIQLKNTSFKHQDKIQEYLYQ